MTSPKLQGEMICFAKKQTNKRNENKRGKEGRKERREGREEGKESGGWREKEREKEGRRERGSKEDLIQGDTLHLEKISNPNWTSEVSLEISDFRKVLSCKEN